MKIAEAWNLGWAMNGEAPFCLCGCKIKPGCSEIDEIVIYDDEDGEIGFVESECLDDWSDYLGYELINLARPKGSGKIEIESRIEE